MTGTRIACLLALLVMIVGCGDNSGNGGAVSHEPGAASPKEAIQRVATAMNAKDVTGIAVMIDADPEDAQKLGELALQMVEIGEVINQAKAKFGEDKLKEVMGFGYMMLDGMSMDFNVLAEQGESNVAGDTAEFVLAEEDNMGGTSSISVALVQKDGRWFMDSSDMTPPAGGLDEAMQQISDFRVGMAQAVETSDTAEQFFQKVQALFMSLQ